MTEGTGERILQAALRRFARDGFEAASMSEIAADVGITKGAVYRHFDGKAAILTAIAKRMAAVDAERAAAFDMPAGDPQADPEGYRRASLEKLERFARAQFQFWTEDAFASAFRRMTALEQGRNPVMAALWRQHFLGPERYIADIFASLGIAEPETEALEYWGGMFLAEAMSDAAQTPGERRSAAERLDAHLRHMTGRLAGGR